METRPEGTVDDAVDPWAWVDQTDEAEQVDLDDHRVTAILIGHNGAEWIPAAIKGLTSLSHAPDRVVLVDAGSSDDTGELFAEAAEEHDWRSVPAEVTSFADGVRAGLNSLHGRDADRIDWLWLLHDDAVARPDALAQLLTSAVDQDAAIATPRLVQPATRQDPARVSELGVSVARSGRREVHVDAGEIDQGQHDTISEVLGGSTCGLLIRRDIWDRLDGLNPALPAHRDGVDLGWRANLAGDRVIAVPGACVEHRQVGLGGLREGSDRDAAEDRSYGMALVAAHAHGLGRVWTPIRLVLGSVLRMIGFLLGKAPDRAGDELGGLAGFVIGRGRVARLRARIKQIRPEPADRRRALGLRPGPFHGVRRLIDGLGASWVDRSAGPGGIDALTGDDYTVQEQQRFSWRGTYLVTAVAIIIAALIAGRQFFGRGTLTGPALLPAAGDLSHAFDQWLIPVGDWLQGPPWLGVHAVVSFLLVGRPEWATTAVVAGAVPLALLAVWPLTARILEDRRVRLWAGLSYALLPVLLGASTQGRLGLIAAAVVLPLVVRGIIGVISSAIDGHSWRAAWGSGVALTLLVAFQPIFLPLVVVGLLAAVIAVGVEHGGGAVKRLLGRAVVALLVVAVALLPWWPALIAQPSWWLLGPDAGLDGTSLAPTVWELALGRPGGEAMAPLWVSAIVIGALWAVALVGTVLRPAAPGLRGAWAIALGGFALAVALTRLVVPAGIDQVFVRPSAAVALLVALGGLVMAGAVGIDAVAEGLAARDFSWVQPAAALAAVVMALTTVLGAGWWVVAGGSGPTTRSDVHLVPAFVTDELGRTPGTRGLAVEVAEDGTAHHVVFTGAGIHLGDADRGAGLGADAEAADRVSQLTRRLVAATGDETIAEDLRDLGIRYVAVRAPDDLIGRINGTAGLRVVSVHPGERVWEISDVVPATAPETTVTRPQLGLAIGQGVWLVIAGFCAAPRLRASRSKDPVLRARFAAGQEVAR